jgi:56kDa selenium binding protein (SBP56)
MEAPPENFAYTLLLSPDFSKPDALAVIDAKPGSPTFSQIVHTVTMPYKASRAKLSRSQKARWKETKTAAASEAL